MIEYERAPTPDGRYIDQSEAVFRCSAPYHDLKGSASLLCMAHQNSGTARWNGIQPECGIMRIIRLALHIIGSYIYRSHM